MRAALALLLALACPGCFMLAVSTVGEREGVTDNPWFGANDFVGRVVDRGEPGREALSSAMLLEEWGEPETRDSRDDGSELWRYKGMPSCIGVVFIVVILPIPLVLPTGRQYVEFEVRDGKVVRAHSCATSLLAGGGVGYAIPQFHGGGWFADWYSLPSEGFSNPFE